MWTQRIIHFFGLVLLVSLFSSCLEDIENMYDPGPTTAVVRIHGDSAQMMANTRYGWLYDKKFSSYSDGKCLLLRFEYNPQSDGNKDAQKRGYYQVHVTGDQSVPQTEAKAGKTDEAVLLPREQAVPYAVNPNDKAYYSYLEGYLFLPSICLTTPSQSLEWQLTYDPKQSPVVTDRKSVYALYLHAIATTDPTEGAEVKPVATIHAFSLAQFLKDIRANDGRESDIAIQLHYVDRINPQDSTQFTRSVTEPLSLKTTK